MDTISRLYKISGDLCYLFLALDALWGAFCVMMLLRRIRQIRFRTAAQQEEFLTALDVPLSAGNFQAAAEVCEDETKVLPQLAALGIANRDLGVSKVNQLLTDHFQRDVLADLEYRLSWVNTVIKTAPMLGLFGTVLGMMAAFGKLSSGEKVEPKMLAEDISLALITTALGLLIAIPAMMCVAAINIRLRKLEDAMSVGLARFLEMLKAGLFRGEA